MPPRRGFGARFASNGENCCHRALGQGTHFAFDLPILPAPAADEQPLREEVIGLSPGQPSYRLLVVEDQPDSRYFLVKLLQSVGFDVREAVNGQDALEMLSSWRPHLVWMDLHLPLMDGYETARRMKADPNGHEVIVIALTASSNFEREHERALSAGCDDFVYKPVPAAVIFDKLAATRRTLRLPNVVSLPAETASSLSTETLRTMLLTMPADWIADLRQAALSADADWIATLCSGMATDRGALCDALQQYVQQYRFDTIQDLTQQVIDEP